MVLGKSNSLFIVSFLFDRITAKDTLFSLTIWAYSLCTTRKTLA